MLAGHLVCQQNRNQTCAKSYLCQNTCGSHHHRTILPLHGTIYKPVIWGRFDGQFKLRIQYFNTLCYTSGSSTFAPTSQERSTAVTLQLLLDWNSGAWVFKKKLEPLAHQKTEANWTWLILIGLSGPLPLHFRTSEWSPARCETLAPASASWQKSHLKHTGGQVGQYGKNHIPVSGATYEGASWAWGSFFRWLVGPSNRTHLQCCHSVHMLEVASFHVVSIKPFRQTAQGTSAIGHSSDWSVSLRKAIAHDSLHQPSANKNHRFTCLLKQKSKRDQAPLHQALMFLNLSSSSSLLLRVATHIINKVRPAFMEPQPGDPANFEKHRPP